MLLSPITLQAYCNLEGCRGYVLSNENQAPLTMQEARELNNFYTSVDRDLSENLEILPDGTHKVSFSKDVNVLLGMGMATQMVSGDYGGGGSYSKADARRDAEAWDRDARRWERDNDFLKKVFKEKFPGRVIIQESTNSMTIKIKDLDIKTGFDIRVVRERWYDITQEESTEVIYYRRINGRWYRASKSSWLPSVYWEFERERYFKDLFNVVASNDPQRFDRYVKERNIGFTSAVFKGEFVRAIKFAGRWGFRAALLGAGIVGGQMLFDYASENHPHETGLAIMVTKEQYEKLLVNVREIIVEIAEHPILDELELPSR